uniref:Uncharacterized protein n=1 Tax=Pseudochlorodesmis sp. HV01306b TaxID=2358489 RepID=A0A386AY61_9CHLO|nr:hypothetical protein [Pseudochlorodesmis sp. HV01306b]
MNYAESLVSSRFLDIFYLLKKKAANRKRQDLLSNNLYLLKKKIMIHPQNTYREFKHTVQGSGSKNFSFLAKFRWVQDWSLGIYLLIVYSFGFFHSTASAKAVMQADISTRMVSISQRVPSQSQNEIIDLRLDPFTNQYVAETANETATYVAEVAEAANETKLATSMARIATEIKKAKYVADMAEAKANAVKKDNLTKVVALIKKKLFRSHYHYPKEPFVGIWGVCYMDRDASGQLLKNSAGQPYPVFKSHAELKNQPIPQLALQKPPSLKQALQKTVIVEVGKYAGYRLCKYFLDHYFSRRDWSDLPPIEPALNSPRPNNTNLNAVHPNRERLQPAHSGYCRNVCLCLFMFICDC